MKSRDKLGLIDVSDIVETQNIDYSNSHFKFFYNGNTYYYKKNLDMKKLYNELLAQELAKDFKIPCSYNDICVNNGWVGNISLDIKSKNDIYIPIEELIESDEENNLTDLWMMFLNRYKDEKIVEKLMNQVVDIFIFDVLIANSDRNTSNYGIIINDEGVSVAPIFDNANMLDFDSIVDGVYTLKVERSDFSTENNLLEKFLNISSLYYRHYLESKLWIISKENIILTIKKIEEKIGTDISFCIKQKIIDDFDLNLKMINKVLSKYDRKVK